VSASYKVRPRLLWQSPAQTRPAVRRARRAEATASLDYCARDIVLDTDGLTLLEAHSYRTIFNRVPVTGDELIDDDQRLASMVRATVRLWREIKVNLTSNRDPTGSLRRGLAKSAP
jgi:hypothetical protein